MSLHRQVRKINRSPSSILADLSVVNAVYKHKQRQSIEKMNNSFYKKACNDNSSKFKYESIKKMGQCPNLKKKNNKIEQNILTHISIHHKKIDSKFDKNEKIVKNKIGLAKINKFFTPKTFESIMSKWDDNHSSSQLSKKHAELRENKLRKLQRFESFEDELSKIQRRSQKVFFATRPSIIEEQNHSKLSKTPQYLKSTSKFFPNENHNFCLPTFTLFELKSYYKSILAYSKNSLRTFKQGFLLMLSIMGINTSESNTNRYLQHFQDKVSFKTFVQTYKNIVESMLKQAVIDYFQILLGDIHDEPITYDKLFSLLSERMQEDKSQEIIEKIYERLHRKPSVNILKKEIFEICFYDESFCAFMKKFQILEAKDKANARK